MPTAGGDYFNLNDYCDRFFSSLYGSNEDEEGTLWKDVYVWEWEEILEEFEAYLVFCKKAEYYPTYNDFTFHLLYIEYMKIGNFNGDIRKNQEFLDLALEMHEEVIKHLILVEGE